MRWMALCLFVCACLPAVAADVLPPAPPKADWKNQIPLDYPDIATARKAWIPMNDSAPVSRVKWESCRGMRFTCNFAGTKFERASWDLKTTLDLSTAQGIQFQVFCPDPSPVSYFGFYLKSGEGWYSGTFAPDVPGKWGTVRVDKIDMRVEGKPAGWNKIDGVRISGWRGTDQDASLFVANIGYIPSESPIAVVWGEWAGQQLPEEARVISESVRLTATLLAGSGFSFGLISDASLTPEALAGRKVAILPYNPKMPDAARGALAKFIDGGGKLITFYRIPEGFEKKIGIQTGQYLKESKPGQFASIRRSGGGLPELPEITMQSSRNIISAAPQQDKAQVAAYWFDAEGKNTNEPAVIVSGTAAHMTHILFRDDPDHKRLLLLAMLGKLLPECWQKAAEWSLKQAGAVGPYNSYETVRTALKDKRKRDNVAQALDQAEKLRSDADALMKAQKFAQAIDAAGQMHAQLVTAYCAAQRGVSGEHRAFWCHDACGVLGMSWDEAIKNLAGNGFTAVMPNMCWGGTAYYASDVLPVAAEIKAKGDQLAACLEACRKYGIECHVWKVNWNMGGRAAAAFRDRMAKEGRIQVSADGKKNPDWLCPSNPANQQLEIDAMAEIAAKYDVDGVHFDYIRYPDSQACFCTGCKERFEKVLGKKVDGWPQAVMKDEKLRAAWLDFRRAQITKVVAGVHEKVKAKKPNVKISAAVFPNYPSDRDSIGQDWKLWCEKGYVDFVCPMDYTPSNAQFENQVKLQKEWAGKVPCYPGIGLSLWTDPDPICRLIDQIEVTRKMKTGGFTVFNYNTREANEILPQCGLGITRKSVSEK